MIHLAVDDRAQREQVARLAHHRLGALYSVSGGASALRSDHWRETRGTGGSGSHLGNNARGNPGRKGGSQMSFGERFAQEARKLYEELRTTPPLIMFLLTCLALLLVGAILVGASK